MHGGPPPTTLPCDPETQGPGSLGAMIITKFGILVEFLAGGIFHYFPFVDKWNIHGIFHESGDKSGFFVEYSTQKWNIPPEYRWNIPWRWKFIPLLFHIYSTHISPFSQCGHASLGCGSVPIGIPAARTRTQDHPLSGAPPHHSLENCLQKTDIPRIFHFQRKQTLHWLSLILGVCVGFWGGHGGYAGVHPHII